MTWRGRSGVLLHGYRVVAALADWSLVGTRVEATARDVNVFELGHGGSFDLRLDVGRRSWIWRQVTPTVDGARFVATVTGRPENR